MGTMATLMPTTTFSTVDSIAALSSSTFHRPAASQENLKISHRISVSRIGRRGHGSADALSGARGVCRGFSQRFDSVGVRVKMSYEVEEQSAADEIWQTGVAHWVSPFRELPSGSNARHGRTRAVKSFSRCNCSLRETEDTVDNEDSTKDAGEDSPSGGVAIAVKILQFYKREISPLLPGSCRFVPTCSEYGMQAFKKYGVVKGAILTAWRLSRCNPLGGSGFDPPRWFDEPRVHPY